eukprot:6211555-Prorocentrum_lima.AAC.1
MAVIQLVVRPIFFYEHGPTHEELLAIQAQRAADRLEVKQQMSWQFVERQTDQLLKELQASPRLDVAVMDVAAGKVQVGVGDGEDKA